MKTKTKTNKSFRPNISHSLFLNGFYEQEFERQKNNLVPYDESLYNNEKQLSREQINQMIAEFGHLSDENKSSKVIDIINKIMYIINDNNRHFAFLLLLDIYPKSMIHLDTETQIKFIDKINELVNVNSDLEQYKKFVKDTNVTTIKYKNAIQRNGDFAPIRTYFKVNI